MLPCSRTRCTRALCRSLAFFALALAMGGTTGCYGRFPMTRATFKFNQKVSDNEFLQTVTFWGLCLGLVYPYSLVADTLVLNPIQFWSGENAEFSSSNAMQPPTPAPMTATLGGTPAVPASTIDSIKQGRNGTIVLETTTDDGKPVSLLLRKANAREFSVVDKKGQVTGVLRRDDHGQVLLCSTEGDVMSVLPRAKELMAGQFN